MKLRIGEAVLTADPVPGGVHVRAASGEAVFACFDLGNGMVRVTGPSGAYTVWVNGPRAGTRGGAVTVTRELGKGASAASGALTPPMPATVSRVFVTDGDVVVAGQSLMVLVAMKTEITLRAPHAGRVAALRAQIGQNVRPGDRLVHVERDETR